MEIKVVSVPGDLNQDVTYWFKSAEEKEWNKVSISGMAIVLSELSVSDILRSQIESHYKRDIQISNVPFKDVQIGER